MAVLRASSRKTNVQPATNFTGVVWEGDWADWNARRVAAQSQLADQSESAKTTRRTP